MMLQKASALHKYFSCVFTAEADVSTNQDCDSLRTVVDDEDGGQQWQMMMTDDGGWREKAIKSRTNFT